MSEGNESFGLPDEPPELRTAVGTHEQLLREAMGNERFEAMIKFGDASAIAALDTDAAVAYRVRSVGNLYTTITSAIPFVLLLSICWSIFFWVIWALH